MSLADYLEILRRRAWLVAGLVLVAGLAAFVLSALQTPMFRAEASILINQNSADEIYDPVTGIPFNQADRVAANELRLMQSTLVTNATVASLDLEAFDRDDLDVSARVESSADVLVATAIDADPERARLIAQTYAETYLDLRREQFVSDRLETAETLRERITIAEDELAVLQADEADEAVIRRQIDQLNDLEDSFDRLQITAELGATGRGRIIDDAEVPDEPFAPQAARNVVAASVLGLFVGMAGALVLHSLDRSLRTPEAVEAAAGGLPILGVIPQTGKETSAALVAEPYRSLRASIEFASVDRPTQLIQVTSPGASAGKTTISSNLAIAVAQSGKQVTVVDGDLRRPRLHTAFGLEQQPGLTSLLIRRNSLEECLHPLRTTGATLTVLPSGPLPPGPSEVLGSEQTLIAFAKLRRATDVVIIDSAPVLPVADALVLSNAADATIVVVNARRTKRKELAATLQRLEQADAHVIGIVLNQVKRRSGLFGGYGYGSYGYGYGSYGEGSGQGLFRRSSAPRPIGTIMLDQSDVPELIAAKRNSRKQFGEPISVAADRPQSRNGAPAMASATNGSGQHTNGSKPPTSKEEERTEKPKHGSDPSSEHTPAAKRTPPKTKAKVQGISTGQPGRTSSNGRSSTAEPPKFDG